MSSNSKSSSSSSTAAIAAGLVVGRGIGGYVLYKYFLKPATGGGGGGGGGGGSTLALTLANSFAVQGTVLGYSIAGATPNTQLTLQLITYGQVITVSPGPLTDSTGSASSGIQITTDDPAGVATLKVTDPVTGKSASQQFTIVLTGSNPMSVSLAQYSIYQGQTLGYTVSNATPNTMLDLDLLFGSSSVSVTPGPTTNSSGSVTSGVLIGANIPIGVATLQIIDPFSGAVAQAVFTVTQVPIP